jgi:hypothetical protein
MDDSIRMLKWCNGILKFPCGVKIKINEDKIRKIFTLFKLEKEIEEMIKTNDLVAIPKGAAYQIRNHLT